jgi:hypothetical protein
MQFEKRPLFWVFPIINALQALVFMLLYRVKVITIDNVSDENAPLRAVVISSIALVLILFICTFLLHLYWAICFSIAIGMILSFEKSLKKIFRI